MNTGELHQIYTHLNNIKSQAKTTQYIGDTLLSDKLTTIARSIVKRIDKIVANKILHDLTPPINYVILKELDLEEQIPTPLNQNNSLQEEYTKIVHAVCFYFQEVYEQLYIQGHKELSISEICDHLQHISGIYMNYSIEPALLGYADLGFVTTLIFNMIQNAQKHGDATRVVIAQKELDDEILIEIRDNGKGIQLKTKQSLQDIFKHGVSGSYSTGYGLVNNPESGVHNLSADPHGGFENQWGSFGAKFSFTIPKYKSTQK